MLIKIFQFNKTDVKTRKEGDKRLYKFTVLIVIGKEYYVFN